MVFPEFAWALDNEILVRDGKVLFPGDNYVDDDTTSIRVLTCLYNYDTQVASILEAEYNLRGLEVVKTVSVNQVKLLTAAEYNLWEGLMIGTLILASLVLFLALPAAIEVCAPASLADHNDILKTDLNFGKITRKMEVFHAF
jgi:hypothetical protein